MSECLCATCFFHETIKRHEGKYREIETVYWICLGKPGNPVVYRKVVVKDKVVQQFCTVEECDRYARSPWR